MADKIQKIAEKLSVNWDEFFFKKWRENLKKIVIKKWKDIFKKIDIKKLQKKLEEIKKCRTKF